MAALVQLQFAIRSLPVHLLALSNGQGLGFEIGSRQSEATVPKRHGNSPHQPFFKDTDGTEAPLVQELPVAHKVRPIRKRKLLLKRPDHVDERLAVLRVLSPVSSKVNVNASSAELPAQIAEGKEVVGPEQDMNSPRLVGERLVTSS